MGLGVKVWRLPYVPPLPAPAWPAKVGGSGLARGSKRSSRPGAAREDGPAGTLVCLAGARVWPDQRGRHWETPRPHTARANVHKNQISSYSGVHEDRQVLLTSASKTTQRTMAGYGSTSTWCRWRHAPWDQGGISAKDGFCSAGEFCENLIIQSRSRVGGATGGDCGGTKSPGRNLCAQVPGGSLRSGASRMAQPRYHIPEPQRVRRPSPARLPGSITACCVMAINRANCGNRRRTAAPFPPVHSVVPIGRKSAFPLHSHSGDIFLFCGNSAL